MATGVDGSVWQTVFSMDVRQNDIPVSDKIEGSAVC